MSNPYQGLGEAVAFASSSFPGSPVLRSTALDEMLVRTFETEIAETGDGRTVEGICVPYGVAARVADPPEYRPYDEMWLRGAFTGATKAPNRVLLDFEHRLGIGDVLGHGIEFEERDDGLLGRFRVGEGADGDKALALIRDKVLSGLSVFARPLRSVRAQDGTMQRVKAHLDRVALCRTPAFHGAQVLAVREQAVPVEPQPFDPELAAKLERIGIAVPDSLRPPDNESDNDNDDAGSS